MLIKRATTTNSNNIEVFNFGKFIGKNVKYILKTDPNYIKWIKEKTNRMFSPEIENEIKRINLIK
jgi:hypothetical protein